MFFPTLNISLVTSFAQIFLNISLLLETRDFLKVGHLNLMSRLI